MSRPMQLRASARRRAFYATVAMAMAETAPLPAEATAGRAAASHASAPERPAPTEDLGPRTEP